MNFKIHRDFVLWKTDEIEQLVDNYIFFSKITHIYAVFCFMYGGVCGGCMMVYSGIK